MTTETAVAEPEVESAKFELGPWQKAWVESLRSGYHDQGKEFLCIIREEKFQFCCLGIACEVMLTNEESLKWGEMTAENQAAEKFDVLWYGTKPKIPGKSLEAQALPPKAIKIFKFFDNMGSTSYDSLLDEEIENLKDETHLNSLAEMNDDGWSFKEIADIVEKFPHAFFSEPA